MLIDEIIPQKSNFTAALIALNGLIGSDGFAAWHFKKGMRFNECEKWWQADSNRTHAHEGVDFCFFKTCSGSIQTFSLETLIPPLYAGQVIRVFNDFIGQSVLIRHHSLSRDKYQLYGLYGHLNPFPGIIPGKEVNQGQQIATIADTAIKKRAMRPHLHISTVYLPHNYPAESFCWEKGNDPSVTFCDPLLFFDKNW